MWSLVTSLNYLKLLVNRLHKNTLDMQAIDILYLLYMFDIQLHPSHHFILTVKALQNPIHRTLISLYLAVLQEGIVSFFWI